MLLHERAPDALNPDLEIPDLAADFPAYKSWLPNHLIHVGLISGLDADKRALFLTIIRRVSNAVTHYMSARDRTLRYSRWDLSGALPASDYFGALEDWENCLLQFQIMIEAMNKSVKNATWRAYERGDRSSTERMCEIANRVKHATRGQVTARELTPLWLEKAGIGALDGLSIRYDEVAAELREACEFAQSLVDPKAFFDRLKRELPEF